MEILIYRLPVHATKYDVKRAIAEVLHGEDFRPRNGEREHNFEVQVNEGLTAVRNDTTGILTMPTRELGRRFLTWARIEGHAMEGLKGVRFRGLDSRPHRGLVQTLQHAPYMDPSVDEKRDRIVAQVDREFRVNKLQFGIYWRPHGGAARQYSAEWEGNYKERSMALLRIEYTHKAIRIRLGDRMREEECYRVTMPAASIQKIGYGCSYCNPYICFETTTPPILEREKFNRTMTGSEKEDNREYLDRIGYLNAGHQRVAPYAHQVRLELADSSDLETFRDMCKTAGFPEPQKLHQELVADGNAFFSQWNLATIDRWLKSLDWDVAFQVAALLHNGRLSTGDLLDSARGLRSKINGLVISKPALAAHILKLFSQALRTRAPAQTPQECFDEVTGREDVELLIPSSSGTFMCHHVSFTPTRILLEGPTITQSNRVIRRYEGFEENFIRVDFRDEDRLQYRWERASNAKYFLEERVGSTLQAGFTLAGRDFEFLAYSQSALREHSVWFMHPFEHPIEGHVTADKIRQTLGDFSGVIKHPSKYAARMAQAFTATDSSVKIHRTQWEEMEDLGESPYLFTDGVGTISSELRDMIWEKLCESRWDKGTNSNKPWAFQIRFIGYKGMVAVDDQLEGVKMRLRPSMNKFRPHETQEEWAEIEIARSFERPSSVYLNRSLIMVLEDRGVDVDVFMRMQESAIADVRTACEAIPLFRKLLEGHHLGASYSLSSTLRDLYDLGFDLTASEDKKAIDDPFLQRAVRYAMNHVLRDIKHNARILVPNSWLLPGVADEGRAYELAGYENVFTLKEGQIYACVKYPEDPEPTWLKGRALIWRSPVVHPGDVVHVYAVGKPPDDQLCLFKNLVNVVVLPSVGERSLASCLAGGDVDGDLFCVSQEYRLFPNMSVAAADYSACEPRVLEDGRDSTIGDVCEFVVEYIHSDVVGLLSDRHLVIADQSKEGTRDEKCLKLAALCSQAVDYPKNGVAVPMENIPGYLIKYKPDWHQAEVTKPDKLDYYISSRAIGRMYRDIKLIDPPSSSPSASDFQSSHISSDPEARMNNAVASALGNLVEPWIIGLPADSLEQNIDSSFRKYRDELRYICITYTLSNSPGVVLMEEEALIGTILAKCSQKRWRSDRMYQMRLHASALVKQVMRAWIDNLETATETALRHCVQYCWAAWLFSVDNHRSFGAHSYGLIALRVIFEALKKLGDYPGDVMKASPTAVTDSTTITDVPLNGPTRKSKKQRGNISRRHKSERPS